MFLFWIVVSYAFCCNAYVHRSVSPLEGRIIGGQVADISEAPYQVSILVDWIETGAYVHSYGGSIISSTLVVTAAHCWTPNMKPHQWRIRAGSSFHANGGQVVNVKKVLTHYLYTFRSLDYDIALVFLAEPLTVGSSVQLPQQSQPIVDGDNVFITGWGPIEPGLISVSELHKTTIQVVNQKYCEDYFYDTYPLSDRMFCAGDLKDGGKNACTSDDGGPLVIDGKLFGITSWNYQCGDIGVWTRVPHFVDWIKKHMGSRP